MKATILTSLLLFVAAVGATAERSCATQDDDLIECPVVPYPPVTELKEGYVVLTYTVQMDGSVSNVQLLESGGDKRWIDAAIATVSRWKYRASDQSAQKTQRFTFVFDS
jgi:TonB family protein